MESIAFEKFGIDKCRNENCNQVYCEDSIKLSVWLYGVIFLHEEKQYEYADPLFGPSEKEKMIMDEKINGYTGITCPKCLKTDFYKMKAREIKNFKKFLNSWSMLNKNNPDNKNQSSSWMSELIPVNLRYYSPFGESSAEIKDFCIHEYAYDKPIDTLEFFDDFMMTISGAEKDLQGSFCSYDISDSIEPAGTYTGIYWFNKKSIAEITNYENEKKKKVFPRYHYFHDLMEKIDSLLKYNYYSGMQIGQVLIDTEESMKKDLKNYEFHYLKKEDIEKQKKQIEIDFEKAGKFFGILISDPIESNPFIREPLKNCDYFWIKGDPYYGKGIPENFSFENHPDEDTEFSTAIRNNHKTMVDLIQKNFHKEYVQEFLKSDLIPFLEKYEGLIRSNTFSYAAVWELKERYLEGLHLKVLDGLSDESRYAMKREGKGWKIIFDGVISSPLTGRGFDYIYYLLSNENEYYYHYELYLAGGGGNPDDRGKGKSTQNRGSQVEHDDSSGDVYKKPQPMIKQKELNGLFERMKKIENEIHDAKEFEKKRKEEALIDERDGLIKYIAQVYDFKKKKIRFEKNDDTIKVTNSVGKAIERALERLKKQDKKAFEYIAKAIDHEHLYQETLSYRPAPDKKIYWILA